MPSTYDVEKLAYDSSTIVELLLRSELVPTFAKQFGLTVISPIASDDVHFRNSSIAAGCNYTKRKTITISFRGKILLNNYGDCIFFLFFTFAWVATEQRMHPNASVKLKIEKETKEINEKKKKKKTLTTRVSISASIFFFICRRV